MARIITMANFIHFNMPHGTDYLDVRLGVDEAWDIAAYVEFEPAAAPRRVPGARLSRFADEAGRCAVWSLLRQVQRAAAQIWAVRADPRRDCAAQAKRWCALGRRLADAKKCYYDGRPSDNRELAMPIRIIGMIGVTPPRSDATLHVIEGGLSPGYVAEAARAHEAAGFDMVLVGYSSSSAEGFLVALHAAGQTERLGYLVAHRPGFVAPTLMARKNRHFRSSDRRPARRAHHHRQDR